MPAGTGSTAFAVVTVQSGALTSNAFSQLFYVAASVSAIAGCTSVSGVGITNCANGTQISITGGGFGGGGALVYVGGQPCLNVSQSVSPHTQITCQLGSPWGRLNRLAVTVLPVASAFSSAASTVSYGSCSAGSAFNAVLGTCAVCPAGSYSTQSVCTVCSPGFFAATSGAAVCLGCGAGYFATPVASSANTMAVGASVCTACVAGYYSSAGGACIACAAGHFAATAAS